MSTFGCADDRWSRKSHSEKDDRIRRGHILVEILQALRDQRKRARHAHRMMFASIDGMRFVCIYDSKSRVLKRIDYARLLLCADGVFPEDDLYKWHAKDLAAAQHNGIDIAVFHHMPLETHSTRF
jgi:hypothetical protein